MLKDILGERKTANDMCWSIFNEIDNELVDLIDKMESGNYSNSGICEIISELRKKLI